MATSATGSPQPQKPEDMRPSVGHLISLVAFLLPASVLFGLGAALGNWKTGLGLSILWIGVFVFGTLRFVRKRQFMVVERFGYYWQVKFAGPRLLIPFIDAVILRDDFVQKKVQLFAPTKAGDKPIQIDFVGGSAPIDASAWYQIGNPDLVDAEDRTELTEQVLRYTYRVRADERDIRVAEIFQGAFRALLEAETIPEAQKRLEPLAEQAVESAEPALEEIGVFPFPGKGIIARDIELPPELVALRLQETKGQADAQEAVNRSRAYWEAIAQMKEELGKKGLTMSNDQLIELYLSQRGLETLQKTGSNVTLVAPSVKGALITIGANKEK